MKKKLKATVDYELNPFKTKLISHEHWFCAFIDLRAVDLISAGKQLLLIGIAPLPRTRPCSLAPVCSGHADMV